ncbi:ChaB family protein [Solimonas soli]|uniref:ChaB family protein n=1 Tax=Solimonas soli TaxID=413479 RepID=UPI0004B41E47|nr:ChaB family protein [Solimonas soli]
MPYASNDELPPALRARLPAHAQDIFRETFNNAWQHYAHDRRREEIAFRVAWAAVGKQYVKTPRGWQPRQATA